MRYIQRPNFRENESAKQKPKDISIGLQGMLSFAKKKKRRYIFCQKDYERKLINDCTNRRRLM